MSSDKPVILLVFANDKESYLQGIPEETSELKKIFDNLKGFDIVDLPYTESEDLLKSLSTYRDRVAILHFAGHSDSSFWQMADGKIHAEGLAQLLKGQSSIQLLFLNGCQNAAQVDAFSKAGIPALIATSRPINDKQAQQFSLKFYEGLINQEEQTNIQTAYEEAKAKVKALSGKDYRSLDIEEPEPGWAWGLYSKKVAALDWKLSDAIDDPLFGLPPLPEKDLPDKPFRYISSFQEDEAEIFFGRGYEIAKFYNLIKAKDPPIILLYGQSGVGKTSFLRAGVIPRLKSPSLRSQYEIRSISREQSEDVLSTLCSALGGEGENLKEKWHSIENPDENTEEKSLIVVVDDLEKIFTHPLQSSKGNINPPDSKEELNQFINDLVKVFAERDKRPRGKLILGFRKEWLDKIESALEREDLPKKPFLLDPLGYRGIIEVIEGITKKKRLREKYDLTIDKGSDENEGLPAIIATDLLGDSNIDLGPILQILLTRMWEKALDPNTNKRHFSKELYYQFRQEGYLLKDFLKEQITAISNWCDANNWRAADNWRQEDVVESGLLLDILYSHTTPLGVSLERDITKVMESYAHNKYFFQLLEDKIKSEDFYLLILYGPENNKKTRLVHNALVPIVRTEFKKSKCLGQRARRILENRIFEWNNWAEEIYKGEKDANGKSVDQKVINKPEVVAQNRGFFERFWKYLGFRNKENNQKASISKLGHEKVSVKPFLNKRELKFITEGAMGMRRWEEEEITLIDASKQAVKEKERKREKEKNKREQERKRSQKRYNRALLIFSVLAIIFSIFALWQSNETRQAKNKALEAENKALEAKKRALDAESIALMRHLIAQALLVIQKPTGIGGYSELATLLALQGRKAMENAESVSGVLRILQNLPYLEATMQGHKDSVLSVAFSPDSTQVVSGSKDKTVHFWNIKTGELIAEVQERHSEAVTSVAFSSTGTHVVSGSDDKTLRLWNAKTGEPIGGVWKGHSKGVTSVAFSPDYTQIKVVSASRDKTLRLWDARTEETIREPWVGHTDAIWSVAFSPDGSKVVSGSRDKTLRLWNVETGRPIEEPWIGHGDDVLSVAFSPDGKKVISGSKDKTVRLWNVETGKTIGEPWVGHSNEVRSVAFSFDGKKIISSSADNTLRLWDVATGEPIGDPWQGHSNTVSSVAVSQNELKIVSGGFDNTVRLWDAKTSKIEIDQGHSNTVNSVDFSPDGTKVVSGSWDKTIRLWNAQTGEPIGNPWQGHNGGVTSVAFSPTLNGNKVISGSTDKTIRLWETKTGKLLEEWKGDSDGIKGHSGGIESVAFSPNGMKAVSGSTDHTIRLWNVKTGESIGEWKGHSDTVYSVAFSPDGRKVVSGSEDKTLHLWDAQTGLPIGNPWQGHSNTVYSVAFSPDGRKVVSGSGDKTLRLWNVQTGKPIGGPWQGHNGFIRSVAFSPNGEIVVSGNEFFEEYESLSESNGSLTTGGFKLWDVETGTQIGEDWQVNSRRILSVTFSPNGKEVISARAWWTPRV